MQEVKGLPVRDTSTVLRQYLAEEFESAGRARS
jgi:hypothetical protein